MKDLDQRSDQHRTSLTKLQQEYQRVTGKGQLKARAPRLLPNIPQERTSSPSQHTPGKHPFSLPTYPRRGPRLLPNIPQERTSSPSQHTPGAFLSSLPLLSLFPAEAGWCQDILYMYLLL
ncbi:hypothetical protein FKM82_025291 [Ascaphus truei]